MHAGRILIDKHSWYLYGPLYYVLMVTVTVVAAVGISVCVR